MHTFSEREREEKKVVADTQSHNFIAALEPPCECLSVGGLWAGSKFRKGAAQQPVLPLAVIP